MFHIIIHCKPKKENEEFYEKVLGAYASILIDYKDYEGVNKEDLPDDYQQYFDELTEFGYSIIFNTYDSEDDDD